ncbi:MAG: 3-dehydroquinate synthase II, partial [Armatimonadota bacterium]
TRDPEELHRTVTEVHGISPRLEMTTAEITAIKVLGMGDRACVDTCTTMGRGEGMLVGNSGQAFFLVHSESLETEFLNPRPFRVNAGAVHAYIMLADGTTTYLSELKAGDEVLLVRHDGQTSVGYVGRNKIERRPLVLVEAQAGDRALSLVMQNAETIYLTNPEGEAVSVASLRPGDNVLVHLEAGGRHLGVPVEETIVEK